MYYQICGTYDNTNSIVGFYLPERPLLIGSGNMQFGGLCRGMNDNSWTTCAWYINGGDNFVRFSSDEGTSEFTGTIRIQGQLEYISEE